MFLDTSVPRGCKKLKDGILQAAEVHFASGVVSVARVVSGTCIVNGDEKKAFDQGGLVWPPRPNAKDDRLGGGHILL